MAVKSTLPIRFSDVSAEFGRNTNMRLGDYLRGGAFVPDVPANSGVPTSLPIRLDDLLGATATIPDVIVNFSGSYHYDSNNSNMVSHGFIVKPNGEVHYTRTTVGSGGNQATITGYLAQWTNDAPIPTSQGADFEVIFSFGDPNMTASSGALTQDRSVQTTNNSSSVGIRVREIADTNNTDLETFTLSNSG